MRRRTLALLAGLAALATLTAAAPAGASASARLCYDVTVNVNGTPVAQQDCVELPG